MCVHCSAQTATDHFSGRYDHWQQMNNILSGLAGVLCHVDDILVFGKDAEEHEARLQDVFRKLQVVGVALNKDKCQF